MAVAEPHSLDDVDAKLLLEVFDKVPSAIIVLDEQGLVTKANASASELLGEEQLEGRKWLDIVSQVFRPRQDDGHEISTRDDRRLQVSAINLEHGQVIQMNDLTETRMLQDKLSHMERLSSLGRMAASLAHQIRTPLSAAILYAANLGNANLQPMARKRFQEKLMSRLEALEAQVSDILMFARSNEQTVSKIDAGDLVEQTVNNVAAILSRGHAELETTADADPMPILGNATALTGALSNLIANAVEAGASRVLLRLEQFDNCVEFTVANNGPAIPDDLKQKIFEPFFTSKSSGTGLGLAVVSAVTKVHQGTLFLDKYNDEFPTAFIITIPLYQKDDDASQLQVNRSGNHQGYENSQPLASKQVIEQPSSGNVAHSGIMGSIEAQQKSNYVSSFASSSSNIHSSLGSQMQTTSPFQGSFNQATDGKYASSFVHNQNFNGLNNGTGSLGADTTASGSYQISIEPGTATLNHSSVASNTQVKGSVRPNYETMALNPALHADSLAKIQKSSTNSSLGVSEQKNVLHFEQGNSTLEQDEQSTKADAKENIKSSSINLNEEHIEPKSAVGEANAVLAAALKTQKR